MVRLNLFDLRLDILTRIPCLLPFISIINNVLLEFFKLLAAHPSHAIISLMFLALYLFVNVFLYRGKIIRLNLFLDPLIYRALEDARKLIRRASIIPYELNYMFKGDLLWLELPKTCQYY